MPTFRLISLSVLPRLVLPAVLLALGIAQSAAAITPVTGFDAERYQGTWYEIARLDHSFERGMSNVTANYELRDDGKVTVINRGFKTRSCKWDEAKGRARFKGESDVGALRVTFFWPFYGGYNIIVLDEDYQYALVAGDDTKYLWILAREPILPEEVLSSLTDFAGTLDFPVGDLIWVDHSDPPVCD